MTRGNLDSNEMLRWDKLNKELIVVSSTLAKGKREKKGIKIESRWRINRDLRTISFVSGLLVTRLREELLMLSEIPDRHIRAIRRLSSKEFGVKPFRGLRLYTPVNDEPLILASRTTTSELKDNGDDETGTKLFIQMEDVQLWSIVCDSEHSVSTTTPQDFKRNT
ncbi:MAG: hypothetical protein RTU92_14300, partial [Candidatus Thorarchaeota archaeon]